ncbi:sulfotransferase family 2 domain-containing protein [Pseudoruegeria sp. HB172150]|uniref:sulfotransferase family 2 domain-containing protein n=1 Tax=Pseudoruegeria sp. HB172150 TaxID=2721164 RepID=UPI00155658F2|nr:sulfotransferase family 2 domain-containing protein [Pseudoruegeria sp. HB172150]
MPGSAPQVFLHLPKCGGTTLTAHLETRLGPRFFHYISKRHDAALRAHAETGFAGIDVVMVHNPKFPHDLLPPGARYSAIVREPVAAAISMYNFATNARHTRNYDQVKDLSFWQFFAYCHRISMWRPNFQSYYLCGRWHLAALEGFLDRHRVRLHTMDGLDAVCRDLTGQGLDPALDRNRAPSFHRLDDAMGAAAGRVENPAGLVTRGDLSEKDLRVLRALFETDMALWQMAQEQMAGQGAAPAGV